MNTDNIVTTVAFTEAIQQQLECPASLEGKDIRHRFNTLQRCIQQLNVKTPYYQNR